MAGTTITGTTINHGITVGNTGSYISPLTITSTGNVVASVNTDAIFGTISSPTINNAGTVKTTGTGSGVHLTSGGTVVNTGLITGYDGITISGAAGTITNSSTITGTGAIGIGVDLGSGGSVVNKGGAIFGYVGVYLLAGGTVTNTGTIGGTRVGVDLHSGGSVVNNKGGAIYGSLAGAYLRSAGTVTNAGVISGTVGVFGSVVKNTGVTVTNAGTIAGVGGMAVYFYGGANRLIVDPGAVFIGSITGRAGKAGATETVELAVGSGAAGSLAGFGTTITNFTTIQFDSGATWTVSGNTGLTAGAITGFTTGDTIDLTGFVAVSESFSNNALVLTDTVGNHVTLDIVGSFSTGDFAIAPDKSGGTDISAACYCRGTRILTEAGEAAVEDLAIGDQVITLSGAARPIKWIGRRAYDGRFIAGNREILPIRIAAGAIAEGVPRRELLVSPAHALYLDGVLAPAGHLVNGATIAQAQSVERVEYFHIELDAHDIIFAEGMPAETYVDCDNRLMFHNAADFAALYPDAPLPAWQFCAARLEAGAPELASIGAGIARRAGLLEEPMRPTESGTDHLPNPTMDGAAVGMLGEGGALPTGWHIYSAAGLGHGVVGHGAEDGIEYVDIRLFGTPTATTHSNQIFFAGSSEIPATIGQRWAAGAHVTLCAGSLENVRAVEVGANLNLASGQYSSWFRSTAFTPRHDALARRRFARSGEIADRNAAYLQPLLQIATTEGDAIDLTLRIGRPRAALLGQGEFQVAEAIGVAHAAHR